MVALGNTFNHIWTIYQRGGCVHIFKMKKERLIIYFLCFALLLVGLFLVLGFKDGQRCIGNPFIYGANKITNRDTGNLYCSCSFGNPNYTPFYFDNNSIGVGYRFLE